MSSLLPFFLAVLLLLLVPGPTNMLLLTAGATHGLRRSLPLLAAEALGYLTTVHALILIKALVLQAPAARPAIQIACALYLLFLAGKIWLGSFTAPESPRPISFRDVLITTLLNPKAFVLAFAIVPYQLDAGPGFAAPFFITLQLTIVAAGFGWIALGALIRSGKILRVPSRMIQRASAAALLLFAGLLIVRL